MNSKKHVYLFSILGVFFLFGGFFSLFITSLQQDYKMVNKRMITVKNVYKDFDTSIDFFEEQRDKLFETTLGNLYYQTLFTKDVQIKESLSNYESMVNQIENKTKKLDTLCENIYYKDGTVNKNCANYKLIYEQVNNIFVKDIKEYNKNVEQANLINSNKLKIYETNKKYIDYNNDKRYDGK